MSNTAVLGLSQLGELVLGEEGSANRENTSTEAGEVVVTSTAGEVEE